MSNTETALTFKGGLEKLWRSKAFNAWMDVMRIAIFLLLIYIVYVLITEIDIVKLLNSDVCAMCMNKTGCSCFCNLVP